MVPAEFFDVNLTLGRPNVPKYRWADDPAEMKKDLARFKITGGLVRHTISECGHPPAGNALIAEELAGDGDFRPVWAALPYHTGEFPAPRQMIERIRESSVAAVVVYPKGHGFSLGGTVSGGILEALEEAAVPLLIPQAQASLETVEEVARAHPDLPVILIDVAYRLSRDLYALLEARGNLFVETSYYMVHKGIEEFCRLFGAGRLLFGSNYPTYHPGCAVAGVNYADISDDDKALIAGVNARRLLKGVAI
ncbi:MAG: amidohydrolase family protein [Planctomycetota bacterium]|jgi:predicted TIM-barrel fold metal-dependent hydrolase